MTRRRASLLELFLLLLVFIFVLPGRLLTAQVEGSAPGPRWIWARDAVAPGASVTFSKSFDLESDVRSASLLVLAQNCAATVSINGMPIGSLEMHDAPIDLDVTRWLRPETNHIKIESQATGRPAAIAARLVLRRAASERRIQSAPTWGTATMPAADLGEVARHPWLISPREIEINPFDDYTQWKRALGAAPDGEAGKFQTLPGFEVRLIHAATPDEGSWVSLAVDPQGRFVIAREDKGLLRMTLNESRTTVTQVETINDDLLECRGLLFAHGALYANANNSKGLYRLQDLDGDDRFESSKLLYASTGGVGHGRNDLALGPDGWIYSIHGDSVDLPTSHRDLTSPFREQRRGSVSREGHVIRLSADGSQIEVVAAGLRNPFGIDFYRHGEMFTYDADAEHDMGAPWYRPTRVNQVVPGGDYGWRGVTGNWPPYFPDHPDNAPPTLDIGKGSPTAVKFGRHSNFPPPYRDALYVLDWAYGRVLAVHLAPQGAGYFGRAEPFLRGRPLNVTDLDFGPDGAMYLVTGGRKTQSALYQIRFTGSFEATPESDQQRAVAQDAAEARAQRRQLESLLTPSGRDAVDLAWPWLASSDPHLVHAARMAIEHQPGDTWHARALNEPDRATAIFALLSLARGKVPGTKPSIVNRLNQFELQDLTPRELRAATYAYRLCLHADVKVSPKVQAVAVTKVAALFPTGDFDTDRIAGEVLVMQGDPATVRKTLDKLAESEQQVDQMLCLHLLRNAQVGWDPDSRKAYFSAMRQSDDFLGGQGMPGFIESIRNDAIATLTDDERQQLRTLLKPRTISDDPAPGPPRATVRKWKPADLASDVGRRDELRDLERGKRLFSTALCGRCHRIGTLGRSVGPDLTSAAQRFTAQDLLREILDPSSTVAENYGRQRITTQAGKVYEGQVIFSGDYRSPVLKIAIDPLAPTKLTEILKADIETSQPAPQSFMPDGLLDTFERDEILDLIAFLRSGGR